MNIIICDDDTIYRNKLEFIINSVLIDYNFNSEIVLSTDNPQDVIFYITHNTQITLYFFDIDLKDSISGIDLATTIRKTDTISPIIFITNYPTNLPLTYEYKLKIFDFILKYDLETHVKKIKDCILVAEQRQLEGYTMCVNIHNHNASFSIPYEDILFIDTIPGSHKMVLHTISEMYEFYGKLKNIIFELDDRFFKCHKSVIVNKYKIIGADKREKKILLFNGFSCPYSTKFFNPDTIIDNYCQYML